MTRVAYKMCPHAWLGTNGRSDTCMCGCAAVKAQLGGWRPYHTISVNALKITHQPHGSKSNNPVMNMENDDTLILKDLTGKTLAEYGVGKRKRVCTWGG